MFSARHSTARASSLLVGLVVFGACAWTPSELTAQGLDPQQLEEMPPRPRQPFTPPDWAPIPDDLEIVVIREDVIPGQFRILDVEISREVDEEMLAMIANLLRDADDMIYQRTYIVYYLPGMRSGEPGWATAHFLPELEVRLLDRPL